MVAGIPGSASVATASITLSAHVFTEKFGFALKPRVFVFKEIRSLRIERRRSSGRFSKSRLVLEIEKAGGRFESDTVSDLMERAALKSMLQAAMTAGVRLAASSDS